MLEPIVQNLSTNGDGTGTTSMAGDYSVSPGKFYIADRPGSPVYLTRAIFYLEDVGTIDSGAFGNGLALSNGITITVTEDDETELFNLTPNPIRSNSDLARVAYDIDVKAWGTGNEFLVARWSFSKFASTIGALDLSGGRRLVATVNDDLTGLVDLGIKAQGYTGRNV